MQSTKPYMLRAIYEWCADQGFTPYIAVVVDHRTVVPRDFVKDGQIVLNVGAEAAHKLSMGNETITLTARFSGQAQNLSIPVDRVAAIYARENGHGMAFEVESSPSEVGPAVQQDDAGDGAAAPGTPGREPGGDGSAGPRPHLVRIK